MLALLLHPSSYFPWWPLTQSSGCRDLQSDPLKQSLLFLPRKPLYLHLVGFSHTRKQEEKGFLAGPDQWGMTETARTWCSVERCSNYSRMPNQATGKTPSDWMLTSDLMWRYPFDQNIFFFFTLKYNLTLFCVILFLFFWGIFLFGFFFGHYCPICSLHIKELKYPVLG